LTHDKQRRKKLLFHLSVRSSSNNCDAFYCFAYKKVSGATKKGNKLKRFSRRTKIKVIKYSQIAGRTTNDERTMNNDELAEKAVPLLIISRSHLVAVHENNHIN